jgi:hypothetical protein
MKSTKPSPFDWRSKPSTLFTKTERAILNANVLSKNVAPKEMKIYSKAGIK